MSSRVFSKQSSFRVTARRSALRVVLVAATVSAVCGCGSTPSVGPVPHPSSPATASPASAFPAPSPSSSTDTAGYKLDINVSAQTVSPLRRSVHLQRGRPVVLAIHSDHDVTITIDGPAIHKDVFVDRLADIPATFVPRRTGVVVIASTDPKATVARLIVT